MILTHPTPLQVVSHLDLQRYVGTWYEIARLPNWFQKKCTANTTATYDIRPDGRLRVVNRCTLKNGAIVQVEGVARIADRRGPHRILKVRFAPKFLSFLPFVWGDYWIIDLASDYSYALVGEPSRKYLWILSRTPRMEGALLQNLLQTAQQQGFALDHLIFTQQSLPQAIDEAP